MTTKNKGILSLLFFLVIVAISYGMYSYKESKIDFYGLNELKKFQFTIDQECDSKKQYGDLLTKFIINDPQIKEDLKKYYSAQQNQKIEFQSKIEAKLSVFAKSFLNIKESHITIHFKNDIGLSNQNPMIRSPHSKDAHRKVIQNINRHKKMISGFEILNGHSGFRFIYPIFDATEYLGSIEFSFPTHFLIQSLEKKIDNQVIFGILDQKNSIKKTTYPTKEHFGLLFESGILENSWKFGTIFQGLSSKQIHYIQENIQAERAFYLTIGTDTKAKLLQFIPQSTILSGENAGYFISLQSIPYLEELEKNFEFLLLTLYMITGIIFYFLYRETNTKQLLKQKNEELEESWKIVDKYVIFSTTNLQGEIVDVSSAFCTISGYSKTELIGKNHSIIKDPKTPREYFEALWDSLLHEKPWSGVVKNRDKDGNKYWIRTFIEPLYNKVGEKVGYKNIAIDISDSKSLEKINKNLKKRIKKAVKLNIAQYKEREKEHLDNIKLSSIGSLAAGITHEINTPLTYIKGNFEMMKYDIMDIENESLKDSLLFNYQKIYDGILRISNIIEAMREIASTTKDDAKVETNLYNSLVTALTMLHNKSKQITRIYLNGELYDINMLHTYSSTSILIHKQRIEQVWIVIINNALDELVKIEDYENRKLSIDIFEDEKYITISFQDNAGGIDIAILDHIFDPFVSSKESGGMGIGLNIAKKIIENNGGFIEASNENDGANFKIKFSKNTQE